ncbi:hypothetical protein CW713_07565, partial [Methanophagales archaeon]
KGREKVKKRSSAPALTKCPQKRGVSAYEYIHDRVSKRFRMPSLAELIMVKRFPEKDYDTG